MEFDWAEVRTFLSVAREGSYSAASRALGLSQPTVRRHIESLSLRLKVDLFRRDQSGAKLTADGLRLLGAAEGMAEAAAKLSLSALDIAGQISGTVRITASQMMAHHVLPPIIAKLRHQQPGVQIELVASDDPGNLLYREADIAVRMFKPEQLDLVVRKITELPTGLYIAKSLAARVGMPSSLDALMEIDMVGLDQNPLLIREMTKMGMPVTREFFPVRCDTQPAHWELVKAGCGIGGALRRIGDVEPLVSRIDLGLPLPPLDVWLATPAAIRRVPRVDLVWTALAEALSPP
ncbi:MAG: LysR family transcriptional regulator [Deltaproteobacteria bacterium]